MVVTNTAYLPDINEIVNLFSGADALEISHTASLEGKTFCNSVSINGNGYDYQNEAEFTSEL